MKTYIILALLGPLLYGHAVHSMMVAKEDPMKTKVTAMVEQIKEEPHKTYDLMYEFVKNHPDQITIKDEKTGNTHLHEYALSFCQTNNPFKFIGILVLLAHGADAHIKNNNQESPIDIATKNSNKLLLKLFNIKKHDKETFIQHALEDR